ncbi:hypothetical protein HYDPIDRAFT_190429 [Hydnomerulius pinastri MD-312]|uniref:Uncharacterized protein n=1 Tax=Hydnomerulius pinastri MD-312 TaxID=994086 RepID=A0A0C9W971_9AGAM|nr:hypothetical protein HYDPIDRAFT_190429 [Hydnomerulius pinastri MD-312]
MINALHNVGMGERFKNRLIWLNQQGFQRMDRVAARTSCPETDQTVYLPPADEVVSYEARPPSPFPYSSNCDDFLSMHAGPSNDPQYMQHGQAGSSTERSDFLSMYAGPSIEPQYMQQGQAGPSTERSYTQPMRYPQAGPSTGEPFIDSFEGQAPNDTYSFYYTL